MRRTEAALVAAAIVERTMMMKRSIRFLTFGIFFLSVAAIPSGAQQEAGEYIHYRLGMKYKTEKQYDKAIEEFRKTLAEYPDNYNIFMHLADIHTVQGQTRSVIADLKQALAANPGLGKAHLQLAENYEKDGQIQKSIDEYQQYEQSCDPSIRDSVQRVIDRLISKIGVGAVLRGPDSTERGETATVKGQTTGEPGKNGAHGVLPAPSTVRPPLPEAGGMLPANPEAAELFKKAIVNYHRNFLDTALSQLRRVIALQPGFPGAYYYAGLIRYRMGQHRLAKINFAKSGDYPDSTYLSLLCLGDIYGRENDNARAIRLLSHFCTMTESEPARKEAKRLLEKYRARHGAAAKRPDSSVVKTEPVDLGAFERPVVQVRIDPFIAMVTVDTTTEPGKRLLGGIREYLADKFDNAVREFKKTLAAYPTGQTAAQCLYNTGICYYKLRLFGDAENQFQQIIDRFPKNSLSAQALFLKGLTYAERKESAEAEKIFREFLQSYRTHQWCGKAWERLGDAYMDLEQPKKAIDAYGQAVPSVKTTPEALDVLFKTGDAYLAIGNPARAFACFDSVIDKGERAGIDERVPDSYYRIADEKYKAKEHPDALTYYAKATRKYPDFAETPWGIFQIGNIHKSAKRYQEAIDTYKGLIQRFPNDYWAKQAQWKLDDAVWGHEYQSMIK
jgi:tetratricopeptide (TPR) repeat protein